MADSNPARRPRKKVLLVEDSPALQAILTNAVLEVPNLVLTAVVQSSVAAIAAFEAHRPDFVILDLVLQPGSGLDVLRTIKQAAPNCCVVVFTAHDGESFRSRCKAAGADVFFSKNTQHQELMQYLRSLDANGPVTCGVDDQRSGAVPDGQPNDASERVSQS